MTLHRFLATRRDGLILTGILVLAAVLRFANLPSRGEFDDDQAIEMFDMARWVHDGQIPLLGPTSSLGDAHHGVAFYYLLGPGAFLTDNNPVAALATLALLGVAGVAATWWLGRTVGGALAGHVAALLTAVSPSAISASTFIWNSNIVGPAAALAVAAAWHAWRTEKAWWWLASAAGVVLALHGHLLSVLLVVPLLTLLVADVVRRENRREMIRPLLGLLGVMVIGYLPLMIHEVLHDFSEFRGFLAYASGDVKPAGLAPPDGLPISSLPIIAWRLLVWPLSGLVTTAPLWGIPAALIAVAALVIVRLGRDDVARCYGRWAAGTTVWAVLAFTLVSPSLAVIVKGLPNDQYHAWLDPVLFGAMGVAVARIAAGEKVRARVAAFGVVVATVALSLTSMPPLNAPDGGWRSADDASKRLLTVADGRPMALTGVSKTGAVLAFPLQRREAGLVRARAAEVLVVVCDPMFEPIIGKPCDEATPEVAARFGFGDAPIVDQFVSGPRRTVTVFARS